MPTLTRDRPLDPKALTAAQRDALTDELYAVHRAVFRGVSREVFRTYVVESLAERTRIQVFRNGAGWIVGYAAIHCFEVTVEGRPTTVVRAEVGLLRKWRGQTAAGRLLAREVIAARLRRPTAQVCFLACPIHPASYLALARSHGRVWPRPDAPTPAPVQALLAGLDGSLRLERAEGHGPHVRTVGWVTRQSAAERARWIDHPHPLVRFYVEQNPGYEDGHGLRAAVVCSPRVVAEGVLGLLCRQARRAWRRVFGARLQPNPTGPAPSRLTLAGFGPRSRPRCAPSASAR